MHGDGGRMQPKERKILNNLLSDTRVLSLGVLVDEKPHVGLLPFVVADDFQSALVHASQLAHHSRGLQPGLPFSIMIHSHDDPGKDALQLPRVSESKNWIKLSHHRLRDAVGCVLARSYGLRQSSLSRVA